MPGPLLTAELLWHDEGGHSYFPIWEEALTGRLTHFVGSIYSFEGLLRKQYKVQTYN